MYTAIDSIPSLNGTMFACLMSQMLEAIEAAETLGTETSQDVLIIMNRALDRELIAQHNLTRLTEFTGSIVDDEGFYLYLMPAPQ